MPLIHHHRKWRKARDRGRARRASLIQQTRKSRQNSYHRSARYKVSSNASWSSVSRRSSDESFGCLDDEPFNPSFPTDLAKKNGDPGDQSLDCFQLKPPPKRHLKRHEEDQQQLDNTIDLTPAAGGLEGAAERRPAHVTNSSASTMEKIRFMEMVAEVDKAVGKASSQSSSSDLDHHTYHQPGPLAKDGQAGLDSEPATITFFSPIPYDDNTNIPAQRKSDEIKQTWLKDSTEEEEELYFNVDIFKSPGESTGIRPTELPVSTTPPLELQEELHAERWECLQQLERRATEASLEGLRKASLKGESTERTRSISSGGRDSINHSATPLRKLSLSRQAAGESRRSKSSSYTTSHRWGSNESNKMEPIGSNNKVNPTITLSYHPTETDDFMRREKLLLRSPSVAVPPIIQGNLKCAFWVRTLHTGKPSYSAERVIGIPLGPRAMSKTSNLSRLSEVSGQTDENDVLMPLANRTAAPYVTPANPDETEVIAIPSSAFKQMVRTSNYLINRKNSSNYYFNPLIQNLKNLNYQDDLNNSNDDVTQPSLIEISLNKVNGEIGDIEPEQVAPEKVSSVTTGIKPINIPTGRPSLEGRVSVYAGSVDSNGSWGAGRFRRLSTGDGRTAPRDKRYKYMKTHPPLPAQGPSIVLPQIGTKDSTPAPPPPPSKATNPPPRKRSVSLGEAKSGYQRKLPKPPALPIKNQALMTSTRSGDHRDQGSGISMASDTYAWSPVVSSAKAWNDFKSYDWPEPPSQEEREAARAERDMRLRMTSPVDRRGAAEEPPQLYRFAGVKSQSEPSLGFLASPVHQCHHHRHHSHHHQARKLRKRSQHGFELNPSEPVPPLPPLPFLPNSSCTQSLNPRYYKPPHSLNHQISSQNHQVNKSKNFLTNIKLFWKTFITPSPHPQHPPHHHSQHHPQTHHSSKQKEPIYHHDKHPHF
ncbi:hypothetical protein PSTT_12733 [Puccinia striiformis]|uniref:Uncharacterized protein n=1 Tax=Puccinia striiformis TaxID=27350 RepID=A0A2S4UUP1_9BASI|nr:hypothetical protein PSTT_12733 [Puccinia striiformis]